MNLAQTPLRDPNSTQSDEQTYEKHDSGLQHHKGTHLKALLLCVTSLRSIIDTR